MSTRKINPESLVNKGIIPANLVDDPVVIATCNDLRLRISFREAFLAIYVALLTKELSFENILLETEKD